MLSFHFCCMYLPMSGQNKARRRTSRKKLEAPLRWAGEERAALQPPQWLLQPEVWQLFPPKPQFGRSGSFHNTAWTAIPLLPVQTILLCLVSHNAMENIKVLRFLIDLPCNKHLPCLLGRAGGRKIFYSLKTSCGQLLIRHIANLKCGSYKPVSENANLHPAVTVKFLLETLLQSLALQYFISWGFWHCNILALV